MQNEISTSKQAQYCIDKGFIDVDDNIEFRTIRDVSDLFNKHYKGFRRSWIKIYDDWKTVASCFKMPENTLYKNTLSSDGNTFYYSLKENNHINKKSAVTSIINHEMQTTYLFLKYPNTTGYKFIGVFEKDVDAMRKSIDKCEYKVIYNKISNRLNLKQFFNK